jgi:hypothetical protein
MLQLCCTHTPHTPNTNVVFAAWKLTVNVFPLWQVLVYSFAEQEQWMVLSSWSDNCTEVGLKHQGLLVLTS